MKTNKSIFNYLSWQFLLRHFFQIAKHGVYEDIILVAAGVYGLVLLIKNWKIKNYPANSG